MRFTEAAAGKCMNAADPDTLHPGKVELRAFQIDVAIHPMPPNLRPRRRRRLAKSGQQGIRVGRGSLCGDDTKRRDESRDQRFWAMGLRGVHSSRVLILFDLS